jgi:acetoacetyl-CoA synthetase
VKASKRFEEVVDDPYRLPGAKWFSGARLNFAENLLRYRDDGIALIFKGEGQETVRLTYRQLYEEAEKVSAALRRLGIQAGDRVAGFMPNMPETVAAMLGATSLGAIWSSCSPDFGIKGVLDRFGQIRPRVLFVADGYFFKGKPLESLSRVREMIRDLPSIEKVVVVSYLQPGPDIAGLRGAITYEDFKASGDGKPLEFVQLPFDHPLYVMFTSGTTGLPKCLVQSAGGILMNHLKELVLHTDLKREDAIFYFTTCGWMMWNWLISSLAVGARVILFDGNPFYPDPGALWRLAQDERITIFGTSAGYIGAVMNQKVRPGREYDLTALRTITSTGSPLSEEGFEFVYREIKQDVQLASISGGSDINGCFALGNPLGPVYSGELQCRGLGMKVDVFDDEGRPVVNQQGELVCLAASPSMPIRFWDDPDGWKYRAAYFEFYPNVWRHGDYALLNERGGMVIYGRSDATLNPGGVRIGTAEIYQQVEEIDEIQDSIVVGQHWRNDIRIILFVVLRPGCELSDALKDKIRKRIRTNASPRHVPAKILQVPDVPYTLNMKKVELAVRRVIEGKPVQNRDALRNPEVLDSYAGIRELQED